MKSVFMLIFMMRFLKTFCTKCPDNTFQIGTNECYFNYTFPHFDWIKSTLYCNRLNASLISIHDDSANAFITESAVTFNYNEIWLGLNYTNNNWSWIDGSFLDYTNWADGEPNNTKNCGVLLVNSSFWTTQNCNQGKKFFCSFFLSELKTSSISPPSTEVTKATTSSNGSQCSFIFTDSKDWSDAEEYCKKIGKHLASIHNESDNQIVLNVAQECLGYVNMINVTNIWLGFYVNKGIGRWSDGSPVNFNFSNGVAMNMDKYCDAFSLKDGTWNAQECTLKKPFSCSINGSTIFPSPTDTTTTNNPSNPESSAKWWTIGIVLIVFLSLTAAIILYFLRVRYGKIKLEKVQEMIKTKMEMSPLEMQLSHEERLTKQLDPKNVIIDFDYILGKGANATVYKAFLKGTIISNLTENKKLKFATEDNSYAAIKIPKSFDQDEVEQFVRELDALIKLGSHSHIISFLGWTLYHDIPALVTELANKNLFEFVISFRGEILPIKTIISILWQVSQALEHVSSMNMVHRDVACRNILLANGNVAKLADFGLCCHCDESFTDQATLHNRLPLKWLSIETLVYRLFSEKSDVWSFGILCYEIFSFGSVPYAPLSNEEMLEFLHAGNRLEKPNNTPDSIYELMLDCWKMNPKDRPKFEEIGNSLRILLEQETASYGYLIVSTEEQKI